MIETPITPEEAAKQIAVIKEDMEMLKAEQKKYEAILIDSKLKEFEALLAAKKKTHGSVSLTLQDGTEITLEKKQTVTWDQDKLQNVYECLPIETAANIIEIKMSVPEKVYAAISDPALLDDLKAARTTKIGEATVKIK
jgi:actin-related protein